MPTKNVIPPEVNRKFKIQFSTPTEDIFDIQTFHKFFSSEASYCLIPGTESISVLNTEEFLLEILPHTTNCILDITMPFTEVTKKKNIVRHLGRYIVCDRQLVGIRIKPSDNWPKSKTIRQEITSKLKNFYDQNRITNYPNEIIVGEFFLITQHFKLAPLFTSELSSLLDNTTINLLNDYYNMGCEIFSIVNDLTEEKKKTLKDPFDILKNYRRDTTVVICSGMHINVDSSEIYKSKSYAIQASDRLKKIHVTQFDQIYTEQFIADLNQTKKGKKTNNFVEQKPINSDIQSIDCRHLRIKHCYQKIDFHAIGRYEEPMDLEEEQNELRIKENELLLYLWSLYVKVNKRKPFFLPLPMNDKDEILIKKILQLEQFLTIDKTDLIKFVRLDAKSKLSKKYEMFDFEIINLGRLSIAEGQYLPIYFSLRERIITNNIQRDQSFLQAIEKKLLNCLGCIGDDIFKALQNEVAAEKIQVADQDKKFIEKFLKRKVATLEMFYFEMAKYYARTKLTVQFVQNMYENMKLMTKKEFIGTPFQSYLLQTSYNEVHHIFIESEQKFFFKDNSIKNEQDPIEGQTNEAQQNNFRAVIKKINYHILLQKKSHFGCHICGALFNKKNHTASYGRMCLGCSNFVCYSCFDKKTGEIAQSEQQFQQCLICQNKCDCEKCMKKKLKNQGFNDFTTPKMSFFRSSNNLNNSTENIRMNEQEIPLSESKNIFNSQIKSQASLKGSANKSNIFRESGAQPEQIMIQPCWTCQLQSRIDRIVRFECSSCKVEKCYECQKAENSKRNLVLRGTVLCNKCLNDQQQVAFQEAEVKILKSKIIALQHELVISKREKFLNLVPVVPQNMILEDFSIVEEVHEHESESNNENKGQNGNATPIFDRSDMANKGNSSPLNFERNRKNSSENGSVASFGGNKKEIKKQHRTINRKNSSDSGKSRSVGSKKSDSAPKNKKKQEKSGRKNSSGSEIQSNASFRNKEGDVRSNSSKASKRSQTKKTKRARNSSAESGQYNDDSSSSNPKKETKPKEWKNYHNNDEPSNMERSGYRPRGDRGGRGGNRGDRQGGNRDFNKRDNNRDQQANFRGKNNDFRGRNDDFKGSNNNRFNNDDRQGGFNNRGRGRNFDNRNQDRNERNYDNDNNNDDRRNSSSKDENNNRNDGLLFVSSSTNNNNEDVDY